MGQYTLQLMVRGVNSKMVVVETSWIEQTGGSVVPYVQYDEGIRC